jgi:hypothetical protein
VWQLLSPLDENPKRTARRTSAVPHCGSLGRRFEIALADSVTFDGYLVVRNKPADADTSLPEKASFAPRAGRVWATTGGGPP